ncbi:MAG TPA: phasin family protein [Salinisphaeraceae bacterium]|nr:phasin family protein [Salinisphaeraceae bacterium]
MYQELSEGMRKSFNPLLNTFQIRSDMMQRLMREQIAFVNECIDVQTRAADKLHQCRDASDYLRVPIETNQEIAEKWMTAAMRQWSILAESGNMLNDEAATAARETSSAASQATRAAGEKTEQAANEAASAAEQESEQATSKTQSTTSKSKSKKKTT